MYNYVYIYMQNSPNPLGKQVGKKGGREREREKKEEEEKASTFFLFSTLRCVPFSNN